MKLSKAIIINWGTLPDRTFEFLGTTALTGETGAGKTSVIDALITVMTGGSSRLGRLNSASDDGKGRQKRDAVYRSIEGYVLGAHNTLFARESAYGYVALCFEPDEEEKSHARAFTAVLAASAVQRKTTLGGGNTLRSAELQELFLLIVHGTTLEMSDFLASDSKTAHEAVAVELIAKHLKDRYPARRTGIDINVYRRDQHADYLRRLYGALEGRGEVSLQRAHNQATVWSRFVGQEQIEDISHFVRQFVLPVPADVAELEKISDGVRASKRLNEQASLVVERLEHLQASLAAGENFSRQAITAKSLECAVHRRAYNDANEAAKRASFSAKESVRKRDEATAAAKALEEQLRGLRDQELEYKAKLLGVPSYQRVQELQSAQGVQELQYVSMVEAAICRGQLLSKLATQLPALDLPAEIGSAHRPLALLLAKAAQIAPAAKELKFISSACEGLSPTGRSAKPLEVLREAAQSVESAVGRLIDILASEDRPLNSAASTAIAALNGSEQSISRQIAEKQDDVSRIEHGNSVAYRGDTQATLDYLRTRLPQAEAAVLCDLVTEVRDERWQNAIEGYLGNARFGIVVKPELQPDADVLLEARRKEGKRNQALIQGSLALKEMQDSGTKLPPESIVHELIVENPYARAYLERQYGNVIKVKNTRDLHKVRNGLTKDGRGSGAYRTFDAYVDDGDLTFGRRARERRREKRLQEIRGLEEQREQVRRQIVAIASLAQLDNTLENLKGEPIHILCTKAETALAERKRIAVQLEAIDRSDSRNLEKLLERVSKEIIALNETRDGKVREEGSCQKDFEGYERAKATQTALATRAEGQRVTAMHDLRALAAQAPWVDAYAIQEQSDALAYDPAESAESLQIKKEQAMRKLGDFLGGLRTSLGQYNTLVATKEEAVDASELLAHEHNESPGMFAAVSKVVTRVTALDSALRNSQLAKLKVEIEETSRALRSAFSTHFCNRLLKEIDNGDATVRALNGELAFQKFGRDTYRFKVEWNTDAYKNRYDFFVRVRDKSLDEAFDMFKEGALDKHDMAIRDEIMDLFLKAAEEGGKAALMQVADYRQYRRYDLLKILTVAGEEHESSISLQMTDSGGEKETGLFVSRVATVTGGLGLREPGPHLKTVVIDELFKKTDEPRIRAAVEYLTRTRELHVIFAMPTRSIGPFKDIIDSEHAITRMQSDTLNGQLDHFVIVEHHVYSKDKVAALREAKRKAVREQAELEFAEKEREEASA